GGAVLEYTAGGASVQEWVTVSERRDSPVVRDVRAATGTAIESGRWVVERQFTVGPSPRPLWLVLGFAARGTAASGCGEGSGQPVVETLTPPGAKAGELSRMPAPLGIRLPAHETPIRVCAAFAGGGSAPAAAVRAIPTEKPLPRWHQDVTTRITRST